jgi:predicted O-methyltransferase YrrM
MTSHGAWSGLKAFVPAPVRRSLKRARRSMRDGIRAASRRLRRANLYRLDSPERVGVVYTAPSDMRIDERIFLYAFVRGFQPERALEIGVLRGGSAAIITNAMQENGKGSLVGIDPAPAIQVPWATYHGRYTLIQKPSPDALPEARSAAGGPFELVLIDGLHIYDQVRKDIAAVLPVVADGAYVLFHDAFHYGVATAIREAVESNPGLQDCGYPCRTAVTGADPWTPYNGFRLLRYDASGGRSVDVEQVVAPVYAANRRTRPPLRRDSLNHDLWYCRAVSPCDRCKAEGRPPTGGNGDSTPKQA